MTFLDGLILAEDRGYPVFEYPAPIKAFSVCPNGRCGIALNHKLLDPGEDTTALFHELGHCETGSFYYDHTPAEMKARCENHANKWAIARLVPADELAKVISSGHTEIWELAELFNVTEDFMRKALCWYHHGNLSPDLYL